MVNWLRRLGKNHSFGVAVAPSLTCQKTVDRRLESPMKDLSARPIRWRAGEDPWEIHGHRIKGLNDYYYMLIASIYPKHWGFINGAHGFFTNNPVLILWYSLYPILGYVMVCGIFEIPSISKPYIPETVFILGILMFCEVSLSKKHAKHEFGRWISSSQVVIISSPSSFFGIWIIPTKIA